MNRLLVPITLIPFLALFSGVSTAQVVFFEDFETPDTTNYITFNVGQSIHTGSNTWFVTATGVDLYEALARPEAAAYDGAQAVDLAGSPGAGVIEAVFATVPGNEYELVFHYARNALLGAQTGDAQVEVSGTAMRLQATVQHDPAMHAFDAYLEFSDRFIADSTQSTLRFISLDTENTGVTLDGISVSAVQSTPGAGRIPQLLVSKTGSGDLLLDWQPSCSPDDDDYAIFSGDLGAFDSHTSESCDTGGTTAAVISQPVADRYYIVVPLDGTSEGSYGTDSNGVERPVGLVTCGTQDIAATCP